MEPQDSFSSFFLAVSLQSYGTYSTIAMRVDQDD